MAKKKQVLEVLGIENLPTVTPEKTYIPTTDVVWDVKIGDRIDVFDPTLSYEATGYRPITETEGLDFNPGWFTETRAEFEKTGKYCSHLPGSKRYDEFWLEQYKRCKYGLTVNGYTITGDNYFFLNFYQLPIVKENQASGEGLNRGFPIFFESHYRFFHYLQLARIAHKHAALMKARSIKCCRFLQ